jgi:tetratricopeptide (TPR) repeat protein
MERVSDSLFEHEERRSSRQVGPPRYEILGEISRGGMGIVYRAWDPQLGRDVALKVLQTEDGNSAEAHERFQREARLAAGLHHANIVPIYDTGTWEGRDYIAMQLIDGTTLDRTELDLRSTLACLRDASRALHYAHLQGIVHRDVKPSNLLLDLHGRVYVTDFGVARQAQVTATMTSPGTVVGTPAYMSPEQALGLPTDARSDVYSIGSTIYEMACGRPPYTGRDPVEVVIKVQTGEFESPRRVKPELSRNVEAIILGAMEKVRDERYASAAELADDIDRYLQNERPMRRPRGTSYRIQREFVRHPWRSTAGIIFCILLLLAGTALGYWIRGRYYWQRAQSEGDIEKKKVYLKKAGFWVPEANALLVQLAEDDANRKLAQKEKEEKQKAEEAKRRADQLAQEQREKDERAKADLLRQVQEEQDARKRERLIADTYEAAFKALTDRALPDAVRFIEALRTAAPAKYEELLPRLRELEFDGGVQELDRLASKADSEAFRKRFAELSSQPYEPQRDRNVRLARSTVAMGARLLEQSKWPDAVRWFDTAEQLGLREAGLYEKRGLALVELQQWSLAERDFGRLIESQPAGKPVASRFGQIAYQKGRRLAASGQHSDAIKEFEVALRIDPGLAAAYHDRGLSRNAIGLSREALEQDLKSALEKDPSLKPAREYRNIALALARAEATHLWRVDGAAERQESWTRVISWLDVMLEKVAHGDAELLGERSRARRCLGDLPAALQDALASLQVTRSADILASLAMLQYLSAYSRNKSDSLLKEALARFDELEQLEPRGARAAYGRGLCRRALGENDTALLEFSAAEQKRPSPHVQLQIARIQLDRKEWALASEAAARAVASASTLTEEEFVGGLYEFQKLSHAEAIRLIGRDAHLMRGQAAFESADNALCITECTEAIRLDPKHASSFLWRGYARCKEKRHKEAQEDFRETVRLSTYDSEKNNASSWLERCSRHTKD